MDMHRLALVCVGVATILAAVVFTRVDACNDTASIAYQLQGDDETWYDGRVQWQLPIALLSRVVWRQWGNLSVTCSDVPADGFSAGFASACLVRPPRCSDVLPVLWSRLELEPPSSTLR